MTKRIIIGVVAILVLVGGVGAYLVARDDDKSNNSSENTSQTGDQQSAGNNDFAPVATKGLPFVATFTTTTQSGNNEAKIEHDGKDRTRYVATQNGQQIEMIFTSDTYYLCSGTSDCIKYPVSQPSSSGINPADYQYDEQKLGDYKNNAINKGRQDCPAGTCDVWSVDSDGVSSTIFIDTKTKRISQVETSQAEATSKIVYEYKDVTINIPANAQSIPTQ